MKRTTLITTLLSVLTCSQSIWAASTPESDWTGNWTCDGSAGAGSAGSLTHCHFSPFLQITRTSSKFKTKGMLVCDNGKGGSGLYIDFKLSNGQIFDGFKQVGVASGDSLHVMLPLLGPKVYSDFTFVMAPSRDRFTYRGLIHSEIEELIFHDFTCVLPTSPSLAVPSSATVGSSS